jgi:hypothetical protein
MIRAGTTPDASAVDGFAFLAFFVAILSVFATVWSWVWPALAAVVSTANMTRSSTRTIGQWGIAGLGVGIVAVGIIVAMVALGGPLIPEG